MLLVRFIGYDGKRAVVQAIVTRAYYRMPTYLMPATAETEPFEVNSSCLEAISR